jgi:UrcA family protein
MSSLLILALATLPMGGVAAEPDAVPSVTVSYADLDLARARDATRLHRRIAAAVEQVCGTAKVGDLRAERRNDACRHDAFAATAPKIGLAVAAARDGHRLAALEVSRPAQP